MIVTKGDEGEDMCSECVAAGRYVVCVLVDEATPVARMEGRRTKPPRWRGWKDGGGTVQRERARDIERLKKKEWLVKEPPEMTPAGDSGGQIVDEGGRGE